MRTHFKPHNGIKASKVQYEKETINQRKVLAYSGSI